MRLGIGGAKIWGQRCGVRGARKVGRVGGAGKVWACIGAPRILQAFGQREGKDLEGAGKDWACIGAPRILQAFGQREGKDLAALEPIEVFMRLGIGGGKDLGGKDVG